MIAAVLRRIFVASALMGCPLQSQADDAVCSNLTALELPNTLIVRAEPVAAGLFVDPAGGRHQVRAFCRVSAVSRPAKRSEINFEIWLPASGWNGRYYQHGEGGGGGFINYATLTAFLNEGMAGGATDNGHLKDARGSYDWAYGHPQRIIDFGYRALQVTRENAQHIIDRYYGKPPHHYYFSGCSGGGAEAMMAAQRFPELWNGVLAGAPDQDAIGFFASSAWQAHRWLTSPQGRIPPEKLPLIERAALASCSAEAHVDNNFAADPRFCRLDPQTLLCKSAEGSDCLTAAQVTTLQMIYDGPRDSRTNKQIYHGFPTTLESGWALAITGGAPWNLGYTYQEGEPAAMHFAMKFFRAFVFDNPRWDLRSLNLERDVVKASNKKVLGETLAHAQDANNPDLSALRDRGGKLVLYTGWGDPFISPLNIIDYHENVVRTMGGTEQTAKFSRLFVVPGMGHCLGGRGANAFGQYRTAPALKNDTEHNILRALEAWAERDIPPDRLTAAKYVDNDAAKGVAFTRPLCPYPRVPVYAGSGSKDLAENFSCIDRP